MKLGLSFEVIIPQHFHGSSKNWETAVKPQQLDTDKEDESSGLSLFGFWTQQNFYDLSKT